MKIKYFLKVFTLSLAAMLFSCKDDAEKEDPVQEPEGAITLKEKAAFGIGAAVGTQQLAGVTGDLVREHFSQITATSEMKMRDLWTGENSYDWRNADALVEFGQKNGLDVHGHTLLWYRAYPAWFRESNYDSAAFETNVKTYIEAVAGRYKGKVISWDVANEIFNDDGTLRKEGCPVYRTFEDPVAFYGRCFRYARNADPEARLFYNDYNVVLAPEKREAIKELVKRFQEEGYPIDGLGDQFHYMVSTERTAIKNGLHDMAGTGLLIHLSELDLRVNVKKSDSYIFSTDEKQKQANAYQFIVETFEGLPREQKFAITTWGVSDAETWLTGWWHPKEYPLLFDKDFKKKPAYEGFLKGLK